MLMHNVASTQLAQPVFRMVVVGAKILVLDRVPDAWKEVEVGQVQAIGAKLEHGDL